MNMPISDGNDYFWMCDNLARVSASVYQAKNPNELLDSLPMWEKRLFHLGRAVTGIMNGGIQGYLTGSNGDEVESLVESLEFIEAHDMLKTINSVKALFPDHTIPVDYWVRMDCIDSILERKKVSRLDSLLEIVIDDNIWELIRRVHCETDP
jgi:hypothetical protein